VEKAEDAYCNYKYNKNLKVRFLYWQCGKLYKSQNSQLRICFSYGFLWFNFKIGLADIVYVIHYTMLYKYGKHNVHIINFWGHNILCFHFSFLYI